jgi:hypothetical protein
MNKNKYVNLFVGIIIGVSLTLTIMNYPSIESLWNGVVTIIVMMFAIWYNWKVI